MEKEEFVINAIAAVGFPIVMCLILTGLLYLVIKDHKSETKMLGDAIDKCTLAIESLTVYIKGGSHNE